MERLKGGLGDNKIDSYFNIVQLNKGIKIEMEHTRNKKIAKEISKDHLSEDPLYYEKLAKMEKKKRRKIRS